MRNPPMYLVKMGLDAPYTFEVTTNAASKKEAVEKFISLGYECEESWVY